MISTTQQLQLQPPRHPPQPPQPQKRQPQKLQLRRQLIVLPTIHHTDAVPGVTRRLPACVRWARATRDTDPTDTVDAHTDTAKTNGLNFVVIIGSSVLNLTAAHKNQSPRSTFKRRNPPDGCLSPQEPRNRPNQVRNVVNTESPLTSASAVGIDAAFLVLLVNVVVHGANAENIVLMSAKLKSPKSRIWTKKIKTALITTDTVTTTNIITMAIKALTAASTEIHLRNTNAVLINADSTLTVLRTNVDAHGVTAETIVRVNAKLKLLMPQS